MVRFPGLGIAFHDCAVMWFQKSVEDKKLDDAKRADREATAAADAAETLQTKLGKRIIQLTQKHDDVSMLLLSGMRVCLACFGLQATETLEKHNSDIERLRSELEISEKVRASVASCAWQHVCVLPACFDAAHGGHGGRV